MSEFKGKKILITGGAGFIGSHLTDELVNQGANVVVLDNEFSGKESNLDNAFKIAVKNKTELKYVRGDICDEELFDLIKDESPIDFVFHEAAVASVPRSIDDPYSSLNNNVMGTLNLLLACKKNKVGRVIFASSSSVYGDDDTLPKKEEKTGKCLSPYALSKHVDEELMRLFWELHKFETVSLRYFNVFGPRQNEEGQYAAVIPKFIVMMANHKNPTIFGDGTQSRDFTPVKNVVDGNLLFATLPSKVVCGKVFNIAGGGCFSLNALVDNINKLMKTDLKPFYLPPRLGDVKDSSADISKAIALGFKPTVSFTEGLDKAINYYTGGC